MTGPNDSLERGYRRLLRWMPADYRAAREDEMIGVLLETARPGQRRPDPVDAVNLMWAVVDVWWRRSRPRLPVVIAAAALLLPIALLPYRTHGLSPL